MSKKIHVVQATQLPKIFLMELVFGKNYLKHIQPIIPEDLWLKYHPPSHVYDNKENIVVNLIEKGIKNNKIYK